MEHLLSAPGAKPLRIPCVCSEAYEDVEHYIPNPNRAQMESVHGPKEIGDSCENFKAFPERKGWTRDHGSWKLQKHGVNAEDTVGFIQLYAYFGGLVSIFRTMGIKLKSWDFVRTTENGERVLKTERLPVLIAEWTRVERTARGSPAWQTRSTSIHEILNVMHLDKGNLDAIITHGGNISENASLVKLGIAALGESLYSAHVEIYGINVAEIAPWGPNPVLTKRLLDAGWCISDSPFFPESLGNSTICADYYFGGTVCPRERAPHDNCSEIICSTFMQNVDTSSYKPRHAESCNGCDYIPAPEQLLEIVQQGSVPVVFWDGETMTVSAFGPQAKYVAISHVWSDGLGNDEVHNQLLRCQLNRIQKLVNESYEEEHLAADCREIPASTERVGFWLDTLCVPVGTQNVEVRKLAIRQMRDVYKNADRTLVLDSFILTLPREADVIDKYIRLHLSSWHHRVWTLQEGQLGQTLLFQFKDGPETFYDMAKQATADTATVRMLCATQLETFYRYFEHNAQSSTIASRVRSCAKYLRSRNTTKDEDEPLCVATILDLDPEPLLSHKQLESRMEAFYGLVQTFDQRIIFNKHPRLKTDGFRWAPRSFLKQSEDIIPVPRDTSGDPLPLVNLLPNGGGLPVHFPGFEIHAAFPGKSAVIIPRLETVPTPQQMTQHPPDRPPWFKARYGLRVNEDIAWDPTRRFVVIMMGDLHQGSLPCPAIVCIESLVQNHPVGLWEDGLSQVHMMSRMQLMNSVNSPGSRNWLPIFCVNRRVNVRFLCCAEVSELSESEVAARIARGEAQVLVTAYSRLQRWCIL